MRLIIAALLMWPLALFAVDRTLSDCTIGSTPTALAPLDLDNCTINDGDDITGILTGLASTYGDVYVKAPSKSIGVTFTDTVEFGPAGLGVGEFLLVEDESHNLTITHVPVTADAQMWLFTNLDAITIGGAGLRMTFVGTHPGLGTQKPCTGTKEACTVNSQYGLIYIHLTDGSNPALADIRANFWKTWSFGIFFKGGANGADNTAIAHRWQQVNIAGLFMSSGVNVDSGVMDLWTDPDRTVVMDPWSRHQGWDGAIAMTGFGRDVGCYDTARAMLRNPVGITGVYLRKVSGGVTAEYGTPMFNWFASGYIGDSDTERYIIRVRDYGSSGPTGITGLPAGVMVKNGVNTGLMKNDPMPVYDITAADRRWLRFQQLPSVYGDGLFSNSISAACADGNATNNNAPTGSPFIWLGEASSDGVASIYTTAYFNVKLAGVFNWLTGGGVGGAGSGADYYGGQTDRTFGHILSLDSNSSIAGTVTMLDTVTVTGPGTWANVEIVRRQIDGGSDDYINPNDNTVADTRVSGVITVGQDATGTVVDNVEFTGSARAVITIGASSAVTVADLCVPNGSTITGTGTLVYEGASESLPFTIPNGTNNCSITADPRPGVVTDGGVS